MDSLEDQLLASFSGSLFNSSQAWDSHLVIPSLYLLVLLSLVFKLSFMQLSFSFLYFLTSLHKEDLFIQILLIYQKKNFQILFLHVRMDVPIEGGNYT